MTRTFRFADYKTKARMERDKEFLDCYRDAYQLMVRQRVENPVDCAVRFALHNGSPRYHVSFDRAYIVVCKILRTGKSPLKPSLQADLWQELAGRVRQLVQEGGKMSIAAALDFVLETCRASRFFMSEEYARHNLYRTCRERGLSAESIRKYTA